MNYKKLYIWVEGEDDKRFFEQIINPMLKNKYDFVETKSYAMMKKEKIDNFLKSIKAMNADYIFITDFNNSPCITARKQVIRNRFKNINDECIIIVMREIEGWYLAGLRDNECKKFKIPMHESTDRITKEEFDSLIPKKFDSRIDFMLEILKNFSIEIAKQKNGSFRYFIDKHLQEF